MLILTPAEARHRGISRRTLEGPGFRRVLHGVYADRALPLDILTLDACARRVLPPDAVATGETALHLAGVGAGALVPLVYATSGRVSREGIRTVPKRPEHDGPGVPLAVALGDTLLGLPARVGIADELLRRRRIRPESLASAPGLAEVARLADPRAESRAESALRVVVELSGLPSPEPQVEVCDDDGVFVGRLDLAWPEYRTGLDYEGIQHATDPEQWRRDIDRYRRLAEIGWDDLRVTSHHLRDPVGLITQVHATLVRHGYAGPAPVLDARWLARIA